MNVVPNAGATLADRPGSAAELVVQNGRMKGARRTLSGPLTLIGQGHGCEVRLNVDGVQPLHCIIVSSLDGYVIRDLAGDGTTLVNGQRLLGAQPLKDGDLISIGPFQFLIEVPLHSQPEQVKQLANTLKSERDALRIQAAAVAAQQAGLTEEEIRLEQRRVALHKQEEQLTGRLEDRQRELRELEAKLREEQATFDSRHQAEKQRLAQAREELERGRAEQEELRRKLVDEQQRLGHLRQRFKQRCQQHWNSRKADLQRRESALAASQSQLQKETEKLEQERIRITEVQLRHNSEMELGRRQLQEEWQKLAEAQRQWDATATRNHEDQARRQQAIEERETALVQAEQELQQQQSWERHRAVLARQIEERENRGSMALSLRGERDGVGTRALQGAVSEELKRIAGLVADQRWHLLEQWQRLLEVQCLWEREHLLALTELESASQHLRQREQLVEERCGLMQVQEAILETRLAQLEQRQESLSQVRCSLEGWQARLQLQVTAWSVQREEAQNRVRLREEATAATLVRVEDVYRERLNRLKQSAGELRKARLRCDQMRKQYVTLWKDCRKQHQTLLTEQHNLTRQTLALERFRMETLSQCSDPAAAEKRLERLQRNSSTHGAEALRQIEREREELTAEMKRMDEQAQALAEMEKSLTERTEALARKLAEMETQQINLTEANARREQEAHKAQMQQRLAEQQAKELREEVERLARMLLDEVDANGAVARRAA